MKIPHVLLSLALLYCAAALAEEPMDMAEVRFAQARTPTSKDELFGAPSAPAPAKAPAAAPKSKDELFGPAPAAAPKAAPKSKDDLFGAPAPKQAAPTSKDELFGAPAAPKQAAPAGAAPAPRDDLFGPAPAVMPAAPAQADAAPLPEGGIKWSGFVSEEAAYTVAEPNHWSRAVTRLQLTGQGQMGSVKYKISGRVDGDLVYASSDFYPADVREDQRLNFMLRENYIDFDAAGLDVRLGRQQIVWGEVVGLFFADVVSGQDLRDFILPSFEVMRIPQWAARVEYFKDDFHAEAVWIPIQSLDNIGKPGSEFYPVGLMGEDTPNAIYRNVDEPSHSLDNSAYGFRMNTLVSGWDVAAFYYRSFASSPTFYREIIGGNPVFTPRHDRVWKVGGTVSKDLGAFVLRGEAVYTDGQTYSVDDLSDSDGVVKRNSFEYIISADFALPSDSRFNLQGFHRIITGDDDDIRPEVSGYGFSVLLSTKIARNWEPQILWIQDLSNGGDRLIRPRVNWSAARNTLISVGADIFAGPNTGVFGRYGNRDRLYTEMRYDF